MDIAIIIIIHSHVDSSVPAPTQSLPPFLGVGLVQWRFLNRVPVPHVPVQLSHDDHGVQLPSTVTHNRVKTGTVTV